jgi:putative acetyltransferase
MPPAVDDEVIGHILFTPVAIHPPAAIKAAGLAPMSVRAASQRQGVGSSLMRAGFEACRRHHYSVVVVVGHPHYYPRFGFVPAHTKGLACEFQVAPEAFMVRELEPGALTGASGVIHYRPEFSAEPQMNPADDIKASKSQEERAEFNSGSSRRWSGSGRLAPEDIDGIVADMNQSSGAALIPEMTPERWLSLIAVGAYLVAAEWSASGEGQAVAKALGRAMAYFFLPLVAIWKAQAETTPLEVRTLLRVVGWILMAAPAVVLLVLALLN